MIEILRDSMWQFVGVLIASLALVISILIWKQRRRKALSYEIISRTPLLSVEEKNKGNWEIRFNGRLVEDVHLIEVKIKNSGNAPIKSGDYERPLNLSFGGNTQILSAELIDANPNSIQAAPTIEGTKVKLPPILLNGGDSITLKMLVNQFSGQEHDIKVDGRIVDVKDIKIFVGGKFQIYITVFMLFGLGMFLISEKPSPSLSLLFNRFINKPLSSIGVSLIVISAIVMLLMIIHEQLMDRRRRRDSK